MSEPRRVAQRRDQVARRRQRCGLHLEAPARPANTRSCEPGRREPEQQAQRAGRHLAGPDAAQRGRRQRQLLRPEHGLDRRRRPTRRRPQRRCRDGSSAAARARSLRAAGPSPRSPPPSPPARWSWWGRRAVGACVRPGQSWRRPGAGLGAAVAPGSLVPQPAATMANSPQIRAPAAADDRRWLRRGISFHRPGCRRGQASSAVARSGPRRVAVPALQLGAQVIVGLDVELTAGEPSVEDLERAFGGEGSTRPPGLERHGGRPRR